MRLRWYFFSLFISLTLLGVVQQYQNPIPNQELVVRFASTELQDAKTQESLVELSLALKQIGATSVAISSEKDGSFHIAYHSNKTISSVKQLLFGKLDEVSKSSEILNTDLEVDVFHIQQGYASQWDFDGLQVNTFNLKSDRSSITDVTFSFGVVADQYIFISHDLVNKINKNLSLPSGKVSCAFPEVRAGPNFNYDSV